MFYFEEYSGIKYYKSSIFNDNTLVHAFSTRIGSNTTVPLNGFSLGTGGLSEFKAEVENNRKLICSSLSIDHNRIINPDQKHTDNIKIVNNISDDVSNTDGVITSTANLVLLLLFADCTPIILYAPKERVLGVIHAGWKGSAKKIAYKAIRLFDKHFNIDPKNIKAAIGPAIGQCCYPVSQDVGFELKKSINGNYANIFKNVENTDKIQVDLKQLNARQLIEAGVVDIDISNYCTSCSNSLFYSYRADNGKTGRHGAIASIKEE